MTVQWLAVEPMDTIMVRDGRRFDAGTDGRAVGTAPPPSTFGGVLHTALGQRVDAILGVVTQSADGLVFVPPADVVADPNGVRRLVAVSREDGAEWDLDEHQAMSHMLVGDGDPVADRWLTADGLASWLHARPPLAPGKDAGDDTGLVELPWTPEPRLGLARHWEGELSGTARRGLLYSMAHLRPGEQTRFLVPVEHGSDLVVQRDLVPLGGRGRVAHVELLTQPVPVPAAPAEFPGGRMTVYLATPALVGRDPDGRPGDPFRTDVWWEPAGATLCALALTGPVPVATATDRERLFGASRKLTWALPVGTVFYVRFTDPAAARAWSVAHHGRLLPGLSNSPLYTAGFGMCLTGSW